MEFRRVLFRSGSAFFTACNAPVLLARTRGGVGLPAKARRGSGEVQPASGWARGAACAKAGSAAQALSTALISGQRSRSTPKRRALSIWGTDRKSPRLNSSHLGISYAAFCVKKNNETSDGN